MSAVGISADKYFLVCHGKTIQCESKHFSLSCASHADGQTGLVAKKLHTLFVIFVAGYHTHAP